MKPKNNYKPDYYIYLDKGQWFLSDEQMTKDITRASQGDTSVKLPRTIFYPQWQAPANLSEKLLAWKINEFGNMVVRNYWKTCEHSRGHSSCRVIGEGQCVMRVACQLEWSQKYNRWVLAEMFNQATENELRRAGF